jgi:hypothetical protein
MLVFALGHYSKLYLLEDTIELWQLANRHLSHQNIDYLLQRRDNFSDDHFTLATDLNTYFST